MYAIIHCIYGKPLTEECKKIVEEFEQDSENEWFQTSCEILTLLSGGSDGIQGFCGVQLWEADECDEVIALHDEDKPTMPTIEQQLKAAEKLDKLHPRLQKALEELKIGVYLVFSTS